MLGTRARFSRELAGGSWWALLARPERQSHYARFMQLQFGSRSPTCRIPRCQQRKHRRT